MSKKTARKKAKKLPPEMNLAEFVLRVEAECAAVDIPLLRRAYEFSDAAHKGQERESGEPYINHCLMVAMILAEQRLDTATIAAGMIHDVIEDTGYDLEAVRGRFGDEIAALVDGVTKISGMKFKSRAEQQVEYFRKMLISIARDIRVIVIKLADRLHNMRTLEFLEPAKQFRIAEETHEVYGPLAHRFGMARIKWELEDLSLKYLHPEAYRELAANVELQRGEREEYIAEITQPLAATLKNERIKSEITGRAKHLDSIYRKMVKRGKPVEEIYDLIAIRVLTRSERDCYHTLGVVHTLWTPVIDRFHDYIATPKSNMYQSLHTTVIGPRGRMVEIQIRTHQMHHTAEYGIAAHWLYKEGRQDFDASDQQMNWLREMLEWQNETRDPREFLDFLKTDLFHDEIFVFTPKGELKQLPRGATPVDFAYSVHSEIGHRCIGARANGRIVPLSDELSSGDEIEIITGGRARPSRDWLTFVKTTRARSKIRQFFRKAGFEQSLVLGRDMLHRELKRLRLPAPTDAVLTDWAMAMSYADADSLLAALGSGVTSIKTLINKIRPKPEEQKQYNDPGRFVEKARRARGIKIQNLDNLMFRFANCCQPVPGERVVGFITRGRGVTIHRIDCSNALALDDQPERKLAVEWDVTPEQAFLVRLLICMENRRNLLRDITQAIADGDAGIQSVTLTSDQTTGTGTLVIEVRNLRHLGDVMRRINTVKGVISVARATGTAQGGSGDGHAPNVE